MPDRRVTGVLLAAGAGRRAGGPKALRRHRDGTPWLVSSVRALADGGCDRVLVVLGCAAAEARLLLSEPGGDRVRVTEAREWADGLSRSLAAGLSVVTRELADDALVHLVDLPDVGAEVVARVLAQAPAGPSVLARATYGNRPGHPVLVGRDHLTPLVAALVELSAPAADTGARAYLDAHGVLGIECGDLASGHDRDSARGAVRSQPDSGRKEVGGA